MRYGCFLLPVIVLIFTAFAADGPANADDPSNISDSTEPGGPDTAAATADSLLVAAPLPLPLCTLEITTEPAGVSVSFDGTFLGTSPLVRPDLHAGKHTLVFQKPGYFQKKAVVDLPAAQRTVLHFQLSSPGRLSVVTEPPQATVSINGERKGTTPFTDSLIKPGAYRIALHKEHYLAVEDSIIVASGGRVELIDTLVVIDAYRDSLQQVAAAARIKRKRFSIGLVAGTFLTFLLALAIIEKLD